MEKILIGNTMPVTLIRRQALVTPTDLDSFKERIQNAKIFSFWGHSNTLKVAGEFLGKDVTPKVERPALKLGDRNFIEFEGHVFDTVYVLSPNYVETYRPQIGEEVGIENISGWSLIKVDLNYKSPHDL